jgi:hypothetical protein
LPRFWGAVSSISFAILGSSTSRSCCSIITYIIFAPPLSSSKSTCLCGNIYAGLIFSNYRSSTEVVVHPLPASRNEPAWIYAEVGARVDQELPFTVSVSNEEAVRRCGADMCRRLCMLRPSRRGHQCGDVVVQDTHVLARMFAAAMEGLMNESLNA